MELERRKICRTQTGKWRLKTNESPVLKLPNFEKEVSPAEMVEVSSGQEVHTRQHNYDHDVERLSHLWEEAMAKLLSLKIFENLVWAQILAPQIPWLSKASAKIWESDSGTGWCHRGPIFRQATRPEHYRVATVNVSGLSLGFSMFQYSQIR